MAKPTRKAPPRKTRSNGWQAEKSAMTRKSILDAAIQCFIDLGYANTTTALIAEYAGVSRGAMMHHFPSRSSVLKAVIEYLHELRINEYREFMANIDIPEREMTRETTEQSVEAAWKYVNTPTFIAYQELLAASRTDPELNSVLEPIEKDFEREFLDTAKSMFPHWQNVSDLEAAHDFVHFLTRGMALSHLTTRRKQREKRVLSYLTDFLVDIYTEAAERGKAAAAS